MRHIVSCVLSCALFGAFAASAGADEKQQWATIKGQVVFPAKKDIPERAKLTVNQDKPHCTKDGDLYDEAVLINPKNRGVKNVVVYLRPDDDDRKAVLARGQTPLDDAKRKPAELVIVQPCCLFINRVTVGGVGDTIVVKNPAPVPHNFFWDSSNNGSYNVNIPANMQWKMPKAL